MKVGKFYLARLMKKLDIYTLSQQRYSLRFAKKVKNLKMIL